MGSNFEFERLTRVNEVCPLCGHTDWCARLRPHDNPSAVLYSCQRAASMGFSQEPLTRMRSDYDGREYVVVAAKNSVILQEINEWMAFHPGKRLRDGTVASGNNAQAYKPKEWIVEEKTEPLPPAERDERYRAFLSLLRLEDEHREYLYREGFSDEMIEKYCIRSLPESDGFRYASRNYRSVNPSRKQIMFEMYRMFGDTLAGVPGFYKKDPETWMVNGPGGILIPVQNIYEKFTGMRIRVDRRWHDSRGYIITQEQYKKDEREAREAGVPCRSREMGKYMWMSSYGEDLQKKAQNIIANRFVLGCSPGGQLGYYYPTTTGREHANEAVFLTEGEKKSIVASELLGLMCIDIPGVSLWRKLFEEDETGERPVDVLKRSGVRLAIVAYDADKETNKTVLDNQDELVDSLRNEHIYVAVAEWDIATGKGLDDLLVKGGKPSYELM